MPPERFPPDSPHEWINRARSDFTLASSKVENVYLEDLCYHAQQCAEKSFKAVLLKLTGRFPYMHDLPELVNRIQITGIEVPESVKDSVTLTEYAVEGRYPGFQEPLTMEHYERNLKKAEVVLKWAEKMVL